MFNACRRGPASICAIARAATSSYSPLVRSSRFAVLPTKILPAVVGAPRFLHVSSPFLASYGSAQASAAEPYEDANIITKFHELSDKGLVDEAIVREITDRMGHHTMTQVQSMTINELLKGTDIIAQARTGTGKTLGFLIPTIQNVLKKSPELITPSRYGDRARASDIRAIIISPTRELAEQIAVEAKKLTRNTGVKVQVAVGGNSKSMMLRQMQREGCHLLVATPGRLNDLLTDPYSKVEAPALTTLVLDEADRLLDGGFSDAIEDIITLLPDIRQHDRQTMLFSATVPREVMGLVRRTLKPDFQFVQTVQEGEQATHEKIPQKIVACQGLENVMPTLLELAKHEVEKAAQKSAEATGAKPFKAIVYFSSTANVELATQIFQNLKSPGGGLFGSHPLYPAEISQMHGKLSQQQRTRVSDRFRRAKSAILFSTDVTARGMDFPNVTHVIQVGLPPNKEQYVHRVGRTGRGDNLGEGWILLPDVEMREARRALRGLPLQQDDTLKAAQIDMTKDAQLPADLAATLSQVGDATKMVGRGPKSAAFQAMLGTMQMISDKQGIIDTLNQWTRFGWGWESPPTISRMLASKLGLSRCRGVNIGPAEDFSAEEDSAPRGRSGGFGASRGGSRGGFGGGFGRSGGDRDRGDRYGSNRRDDFGGDDRRGFQRNDRSQGQRW